MQGYRLNNNNTNPASEMSSPNVESATRKSDATNGNG